MDGGCDSGQEAQETACCAFQARGGFVTGGDAGGDLSLSGTFVVWHGPEDYGVLSITGTG